MEFDYGFFKAFQRLCKDVRIIRKEITQQAADRAAIVADTQLLKESGDSLAKKVRENPAPAP